jgi:hypothetical protein
MSMNRHAHMVTKHTPIDSQPHPIMGYSTAAFIHLVPDLYP